MPYEEYTPTEAEINKIIRPGMDDDTDGELNADEFQDMLDELEQQGEKVLVNFLDELKQTPWLRASLNTAYRDFFKQYIDQEDTGEVGRSFQSLVLGWISKEQNPDISSKQLYGLSLLYAKIPNFCEFIKIAEDVSPQTPSKWPLRFDVYELSTNEIVSQEDPLNHVPKWSPDHLVQELQLPINVFLENINPEQLRAYITQLTANGVKLPHSINDLSWLLAYTPERLTKLIETCAAFPFAKITKRTELRDFRNHQDLDEIKKKLSILSSLPLQELKRPPNPSAYIFNVSSHELQNIVTTLQSKNIEINTLDIFKWLIPATGGINFDLITQQLEIVTEFSSETPATDLVKLWTLYKNEWSLERISAHKELLGEYASLFRNASYTLDDIIYLCKYSTEEFRNILSLCQKIAEGLPVNKAGTKNIRTRFAEFKDFLDGNDSPASLSSKWNAVSEQGVNIKCMADLLLLHSMPADTFKNHMSVIQTISKEHWCKKEFLEEFFIKWVIRERQTEIVSLLTDFSENIAVSKKRYSWINTMLINEVSDESHEKTNDFERFILLLVDAAHKKIWGKVQLEHCNPSAHTFEQIKKIIDEAKDAWIPINFSQVSSEYPLWVYLDDIENQLASPAYTEANTDTETVSDVPASLINEEVKWVYEQGSFNFGHYKELFSTPWSHDLFTFLSKHPQKLENLGGKIINSISLPDNIHWFRGVLEMIKSREDIDLPETLSYTKDSTERKQQREKIIAEYRKLIMYKISLDFTTDSAWNRIEKGKSTFGQIFFAGAQQNYENAYELEWEIHYVWWEDHNWAFRHVKKLQENLARYTVDNGVQTFSSEYVTDQNWNQIIDETKPKQMKDALRKYAGENPDERILVYIWYHGDEKGDAPPFTKQDFLEIANISPRITILSDRCSFGDAYDNELQENAEENSDYMYNMQSALSGAANKHVAYSMFGATLTDKLAKKNSPRDECGFHEAELYTRMLYDDAFSPLTVNREYTNRKTWKQETKNIWLAAAESVPEMDKPDRISLENTKEWDA